jgi:hypothetical protein
MNLFASWCQLRGVHHLPAPVQSVAQFVMECGHLAPEVLHAELIALDVEHERFMYAPPARSTVVVQALNKVHPVDPPRSWPKSSHELFLSLPWGIQRMIVMREHERDRALSKAQNEAAEMRKRVAELEKRARDVETKTAA